MDRVRERIEVETSNIEHDVELMIESSKASSMFIPILVTLLLLLLGGFLMKKHSLISSNKRSFVICGLQGNGKTNLFHLLTVGKLPVLTVSSLEPKRSKLLLDEEHINHKTFQDIEIIDFPANSKLKNLYLLPYFHDKLNEIQGIIYIIDSSNFDNKVCHETAEDLLKILEITEGKPNGVDMIIFSNKNDLFTSKKSSKIKEMLESEIGKIHELKLRGLGKVESALNKVNDTGDDDGDDNLDLAIKDGTFQFQLLDSNVFFAQGNIFKDNWSMIDDWIFEKIVN